MHIRDFSQHSKTLSEELQFLADEFQHHPVKIEEVIDVLQERAYTLLIIILCLPFCGPVSIPGTSTPLGLVIAFTAARYFVGLPPHLPRKLLDTELPPRFFRVLLAGAGKIIGFIERALKPRLLALTATPRRVRVHAGLVFTGAVILLIPAPIPLSNTLPALAVLLGATGVMERDGVAILAGYVFAVLGAAYFVLIAVMGAQAYDFVVQELFGA